jgi:hypothetical protein
MVWPVAGSGRVCLYWEGLESEIMRSVSCWCLRQKPDFSRCCNLTFNWHLCINIFTFFYFQCNLLQYIVLLLTVFFWVKSPCGLVGRSQRLGDACRLHLQGWSDEFTWSLLFRPPQLLPRSSRLAHFPHISLLQSHIYGPSQYRLTASTLKMQAARFSETLASTNQSTRWFNSKEHNKNCHRRENLKPQTVWFFNTKEFYSRPIWWLHYTSQRHLLMSWTQRETADA